MKDNINNSGNIWHTISGLPKLIDIAFNYTAELLNIPEMPQLMKEDFDLLIYEGQIGDVYLGLAAHFKCPTVAINSFEAQKPLNDLVGNPTFDSLVSSFFMHNEGIMTFPVRVLNYILNRLLLTIMIGPAKKLNEVYL